MRLLKAAALIAGVTLASKLLGAVRDWLIMTQFGASVASDAYFAAFQLPSFALILLGGLGGPFHTATVAIFTRLKGTPEQGRRLAGQFLGLTGLLFSVLAVAVFCLAEPIMGAILQGATPELVQTAALHLKILSPVILLGGLMGILFGLANVQEEFFWPSFSPAAMSLVMIAGLVLLPADPGGLLLAWTTLLGACVQVALQVPSLIKHGVRPGGEGMTTELKQLSALLFPAMIGTTMGQINVYVDMFFTSALPVGGWSAIVIGNRLIQLPLGVLQTALLVPLFPRLNQYVVGQQWDDLRRTVRAGVVSLWLVSIPMLVVLWLGAETLIGTVFQRGAFTARDTQLVAWVVTFLGFSMVPYFARDTLTRVFYAFQDAKTPLYVGMIAIVANAALDALLVGPLGVGGIALSTSLVTLLNMTLLAWLVRRHIPALGMRRLLEPFAKLCAAGVAMAALTWGLWGVLAPGLGAFAGLLVASAVGIVLYGGCVLLLGVPEARTLTDTVLRRLRPSSTPVVR
jgi:putative peptidoglycan lipid II flippase